MKNKKHKLKTKQKLIKTNTLYLGIHLNEYNYKSIIDGLEYTKKIGGKILQVYLGDKRLTTLRKKIKPTKEEIHEIKDFLKQHDMKLVVHAILTLNYCNDPTSMRYRWGLDNLIYDMKLAHKLNAIGVVIHMGTHKTEKLNITYDKCVENFVNSIKFVLDNTKSIKKTPIILETPVNRKNIVAGTIEGLAALYNKIPENYRKRIKICIDTQHIFVSGYNLRNVNITEDYLKKVDKLIGVKNIALLHLNDSEKEFNSRINRHTTTQKGFIFSNGGKESLQYILQFSQKHHIPLVLETVYDNFKDELKNLKILINEKKGGSKTIKNKITKNKITKNKTMKNKTMKNKTMKNKTIKNKTMKNKTIKNKIIKKNIKSNILKIFGNILSFHESLGKEGNISTKYRINSYKKAIKSLELYNKHIYSANNIKNQPFIGKGFYNKINEISKTGKLKLYENLKKEDKLSKINNMKQLKKIWGIGNIKAKELINKKIHTINNLKKSIKNKKIILTEQQMLGLKYYDDLNKRIPRKEITLYTNYLKNIIKDIEHIIENSNVDYDIANSNISHDSNIKLELYNAGSYRMNKETSGDIDLILTVNNSKYINKVQELFYKVLKNKNFIKETLSKGTEKSIYIVKLDNNTNLDNSKLDNTKINKTKYYRQMDVAFIDHKYLPWYLLYFGSSKEFSKKIRMIASKKGYKLNEKGLFNKNTGKRVNFNPTTEKEIFDYLDLEYIKPENRK